MLHGANRAPGDARLARRRTVLCRRLLTVWPGWSRVGRGRWIIGRRWIVGRRTEVQREPEANEDPCFCRLWQSHDGCHQERAKRCQRKRPAQNTQRTRHAQHYGIASLLEYDPGRFSCIFCSPLTERCRRLDFRRFTPDTRLVTRFAADLRLRSTAALLPASDWTRLER